MVKRQSRLDQTLIDRGLFNNLREAVGHIMSGKVVVGGEVICKPGIAVKSDAEISLRGTNLEYASRGGYKLARALDVFPIDVAGRTVLDVGASTGGFTDCLLKHGAKRVVAVDVGYGQLRGYLATDQRVDVLEKTNISGLDERDDIDFCTVDISYLTLLKALPILRSKLGEVPMICLIKPLYEGLAEEQLSNKTEVVVIVKRLLESLEAIGIHAHEVCLSPILGSGGAIELLAYFPGRIHIMELMANLEITWKLPSAGPV